MNDETANNAPMDTATNDNPKGAGVRVPPPAIFLLCLLAGIGLNYILPLGLGISEPLNMLGLVFVAVAIAILVASALLFRRAHTAIEPWKPTTSMIYSGCYGLSRNPIYLSFCLCLFGVGVTVNSLWILLSFVPCGLAIYYFAIKKEEAYLEQKFGDEYLLYKQRVRRWI